MDYKELIELSKKAAAEWQGTHEYYQAATLITALCEATETLLAEREAAVEDLRGRCDICKHQRVCLFDEQHKIGCANSKRGHWQWRGPTPPDRQKEER